MTCMLTNCWAIYKHQERKRLFKDLSRLCLSHLSIKLKVRELELFIQRDPSINLFSFDIMYFISWRLRFFFNKHYTQEKENLEGDSDQERWSDCGNVGRNTEMTGCRSIVWMECNYNMHILHNMRWCWTQAVGNKGK